MQKSTFKLGLSTQLLITLTLLLTNALIPGVSWAQQSSDKAQSSDKLEEVVITGSRIARNPNNYVGPMSIVTGTDIERIPTYSIQDMLLRLPSIGLQGTTRNLANGGRGAQFTGIHQLAPERTLVLLNGRRMVGTVRDTTGLAVDMQSFPINMIQNIEVLADGASAIYGSDAVAGVINVKTKRDFNGVELTGGVGQPQHPGGDSYNAGILVGISGDRGYVTAAATIVDNGRVDDQQRKWSKVPILGQIDAGGGLILTLMGSGIPPEGRQPDANIIFKPNPATGASYENYDTFGLSGLNGSAGDGSLQSILDTGHRFNYNNIATGIDLISASRVFNGAVTGELNLNSLNNAKIYFELLGAHREGTLHFTPLPIADAAGRFTDLIQVPFTNPHIPADALPVIQAAVAPGATQFQMYWRGLELGPRMFSYNSDTVKTTFGLKGDLNFADKTWQYDTWLTYGRSTLDELTHGQVNVAKLQTAVNPAACALDSACPKDAFGNPTLNIFGLNPTSPEEKAYVLFDDQDQTNYDMWHMGGTVTGNIWDLPAGPVGMAAGAEWRRESGGDQTSGVVQAGDSGGNYASPTKGHFTVWELFAEFQIPLLVDQQFAKELSLNGAVRYSDYNTVGNETTYKVSMRWSPVESFSLRGVYSTGFRAPNILESFGGVSDSYLAVNDPCDTSSALYQTNTTVQANCAAQGVPLNFIPNASQLKVSQGGNPDLKPETSENFSVGAVWKPEMVENLSFALDYYDVTVKNAIKTPDPVDVINNCYESTNLSSPECVRIGRGASGTVIRFDLLNENLAKVVTSGIDANARYTLPVEYGEFRFDGNVNWLRQYKETTDAGVVSDRTGKVAGLISDWSGYPKWRSTLDVAFNRNNWTIGGEWRYLDSMKVYDAVGVGTIKPTAPAFNYFDLYGNYRYKDFLEITVGADNITDKAPPYVPDTSDNTSAIYDFLGRFYYARFKLTFD